MNDKPKICTNCKNKADYLYYKGKTTPFPYNSKGDLCWNCYYELVENQ